MEFSCSPRACVGSTSGTAASSHSPKTCDIDMSLCVNPGKGRKRVQGELHLWPSDSWDWLQPPTTQTLSTLANGWLGGIEFEKWHLWRPRWQY